jgi:hypothetical protein
MFVTTLALGLVVSVANCEMAKLELNAPCTPLETMRQKVAAAKAEMEAAIAEKNVAFCRLNAIARANAIGHAHDGEIRVAKLHLARCYLNEMDKQMLYEQALRELEAFNGV